MVVAVFVLCIALGSFAVSALPRIGAARCSSQPVRAGRARCAGSTSRCPTRPTGRTRSRAAVPRRRRGAFYPYYLVRVFARPARCARCRSRLSGATLPLLFHHLRREVGDLGAVAGALYSVEHGRLAARRAARRLRAAVLARPAPRLPDRRRRAGARGRRSLTLRVATGVRAASRRSCGRLPGGRLALLPAWDPGYAHRRACSACASSCEGARGRAPALHDPPQREPGDRLLRRRPRLRRSPCAIDQRCRGSARLAQHHRQRQIRRQHPGRLPDDGAAALVPALLAERPEQRLRDRLRHRRHRGRARGARRHAAR